MHHALPTLKHILLGLAISSSLALGAVAVPVASAADTVTVPFSATIHETFTIDPACLPTRLCAAITGSGQATQLGKIVESATIVSNHVTPLGGGCFSELRTATRTAANGDQLTIVGSGKNCPTGPTTVLGSDTYHLTGGSGRFSGATGSGTVSASVNRATSTAVATLSGTLSAPGAQAQMPAGMLATGAGGTGAPHRSGLAILAAPRAGLVGPRLLVHRR